MDSDAKFSAKRRRLYTFPARKESGGSNAHEMAIKWAKDDDVAEYAQKVAFYKTVPYVIEKTPNSDDGYRIVERLTQKEYKKMEGIC